MRPTAIEVSNAKPKAPLTPNPGLVPMMLKTFFGIETVFSRSPWTMVNTTTLAATLAATYLCFDPIRKALFVLRCFHGASLKTGEDLRVELKALRHARDYIQVQRGSTNE